MEVYDTRVAGFSHSPCNRFGVRDSGKMHARSFYKGSSLENCFARGYSDGQVLIWDLKNLKVRFLLMFHFTPRLTLDKTHLPSLRMWSPDSIANGTPRLYIRYYPAVGSWRTAIVL